MTHPPDNLLLGLATGAVLPDQSLHLHVEQCAACQARVESLRQVHAILGEWTVEPGGQDVTAAVLERIDAEAHRPSTPLLAWRKIGRYAAAILVGIGVGYAGSHALGPPTGSHLPAETGGVEPATDLSLELLARPASTGLWLTVVELDPIEATREGGA